MTDTTDTSLIDKTDVDLFRIASEEVQGSMRKQDIWAKALSYSSGDEQIAQSKYIFIRLDQLMREKDRQVEHQLHSVLFNSMLRRHN